METKQLTITKEQLTTYYKFCEIDELKEFKLLESLQIPQFRYMFEAYRSVEVDGRSVSIYFVDNNMMRISFHSSGFSSFLALNKGEKEVELLIDLIKNFICCGSSDELRRIRNESGIAFSLS